jgi:hypothetical protein
MVRVARASPRKVTTVFAKPATEPGRELPKSRGVEVERVGKFRRLLTTAARRARRPAHRGVQTGVDEKSPFPASSTAIITPKTTLAAPDASTR